MADFSAVYSVGESIAQFLRNTYPDELRKDHPFKFELAKSEDFSKSDPFNENIVSIFLYRITPDQYLHPAGTSLRRGERPRTLPLDLHFLVSAWSDSKHAEHLAMTWPRPGNGDQEEACASGTNLESFPKPGRDGAERSSICQAVARGTSRIWRP